MRLTREQAKNYSQGGSSFFKLEDGETGRVRFLYNTINDIEFLAVHSINQNGQYATIDCNRLPSDPIDKCKWCSQQNRPVSRVVIPLFNLDANEVQYWTRTEQWVEGTLIPTLEETIPQGQPISGQNFKIKRTGKELKTTYNIMPEMGTTNDGKTRDQFGEVKDPYEANIIKPTDYEFPVQNNTQQVSNFQSTRRTTDVF